ncbi:MAG: Ig-like domain-containing protein, partial [Bacteroidota bacterium]
MKKLFLPLFVLLIALSASLSAQTTATYSFTALTGTYASISGTGTSTTALSGDDLTLSGVGLGFTFNFCGVNYTTLSVCSNGWVSLPGTGVATFTNASANIATAGWLMPFWDDLHGAGHTAYYQTTGTAPNRVFTFEWNNFHTFSAAGNGNIQLKLYETSNVIEFWYGTSTYSGISATIGIANSTTDWQSLPTSGTSPTPSFTTFTTGIGSSPANGQIYRWSPCPVTVTATNSGAACPGGSVTLSGTSTGTSFTWNGPGGYSAATLTATVSPITTSSGGTYTLVASNGTCTMSATTVVTVSPTPPTFAITPASATTCGSAVMLSAPPLPATDITTTFSSTGSFTVPDATAGGAIGNVTVSGIPSHASVADISVLLNSVTMTFVGDLSFNIVAPNGNNLNLFNQHGGTGDNFVNTNVTSLGGTAFAASAAPYTGAYSATAASGIGPTGFLSNVTTWTPLYSILNGTWQLAARDWTTTDIATVNSWAVRVHYTTPAITYTWAPTAGLYLDAALTVPYTGVPTNTVYAAPASTTVYTATATLAGPLCTNTATSTITYSGAAGTITGPTSLCAGATMTLANATTGGTWSSSSTGIATIGSSTGIVSGVSGGTATISYTLTSGCFTIYNITVNATPPAITGTAAVCVGATTTLANTLTGGTWSSSNTAVGTVGASTGIVAGITSGTTTITYITAAGCFNTRVVTVNPLPAAITGATFSLCAGQTISLSNVTPGGIWQSSTTSVATVSPTTGTTTVVTGVSAGTSTISYRVSGCAATVVVTVVSAPSAIGGSLSVCLGSTSSLTSSPPGGTWTSSNLSVAPINASTGVVSGITLGTSSITYSIGVGCVATAVVTVIPLPAAITGTMMVCPGTTTTLSDASAGGTWSASAGTGTVTVASGTGVVTGGTVGTATVTYTVGTGCYVTTTVTVNPNPSAIVGLYTMCAGSTSTFTDATPGGTWSSSSAIVTIGSSSGIATAGVSAGTATITYRVTATNCFTTATITVNPLPAAIVGGLSVCPGLCTTLTDATAGGTWSISSATIATVSASGVVCGVSAGTATVTYTAGTGCYRTATVTVNTPPAAISGPTAVCFGYTITMTNATGGGTWSSSNATIASVGSLTGVVTGNAVGTATITYTAATGCFATTTVTVNPGPGVITGTLSVCIAQTTTLSTSAAGGIWSSSNPAVATVNASGVVTGMTDGTSTITYSLGTGCVATAVVTVTPLPAPITGTPITCVGSCTTLADASTGGAWTISPATVATVTSGTGVVCGVSAGTATVTYTTGCPITAVVTVNPLPAAITGTLATCAGSCTTLSNASAGGTWSISSAVATVGSATGIVCGITAGTATVTYTLPTGCRMTAVVTVNPLPTSITSSTGSMNVCVGSTIVLSGAPTGGTWISSNTAIATIGSSSGVLTGVTAGTVTITYTLSTGCSLTTTVTVNPLPSAITGGLTVCPGTTTTLSNTSTGGIWSSGNLSIATVGTSSGVVTGGPATGPVTITYTLPTGCRTTVVVTNNPLPAAISGTPTVCEGQNTTLSSGTSGGSWSTISTNVTIGSSTGIVSGVTAGTAVITYTLSATGCYRTITVTVQANPAAITGAFSVCAGLCTTLSSTTPGGAWISSNTAVATVAPSTGVVCGVSAGTTTITYIMSTGCYSTAVVTVTTAPTAITGTLTVCEGSTTTLSSGPSGGTWSSSNTAVGTVDAATGVVTGILTGTTTITYSLGTGCTKTAVVTVNTSPAIIMGSLGICTGTTTTLSNGTPGGTWSSSNPSVATVSSGGVVTGVSCPATVTISYTLSSGGCSRMATVTVNCLPAAITGTMTVCQGQTTTASSATAGGVWTSSNTAVATVNSSTGVITGVSGPGTATITYSLGTGCITTAVVTVLPLPAAIGGALNVCIGFTTTLTDATPGGTWSSSDPSVATISSTGVVSGLTAGTTTITYMLTSTGCYITAVVTVNPLPSAIMGATGFCNLTTTTLSNATPGGTWSSADPAIAYFPSPGSGALTASGIGTVNVCYTLPTGCSVCRNETIILAPFPITGPADICEGSCITLGNIISGGTWTSTTPAVATITTPGGVLCGLTTGTTSITYELSNGCYSTQTETVNATPGAITGTQEVCVGLTTTLSNGLAGGAWSSGDITIAIVDAGTGVVTGMDAGTVVITYAMGTGCYAMAVVTVNPLPEAISGPTDVCVGLTITLSSASGGGTWGSANPSIADVSPTGGVVTGISSGTVTITYTLPTGCITTIVITVNPLPSAITGIFSVCVGNTSTLDNISTGGTWSSSNMGVATVGLTSGIVTGTGAGTATITYTLSTGCISTIEFSVNPLPTA